MQERWRRRRQLFFGLGTGGALLLLLVSISFTYARQYFVPEHNKHRSIALHSFIGPKKYYLALGDSLAFGYQPTNNTDFGYANDFFADLRHRGTTSLINMGCSGETTGSMIRGSCPKRKYPYRGSQLQAAVNFIKQHRGQVSPVTLDIGINDEAGDVDDRTCQVNGSSFHRHLLRMDQNMSKVILRQLVDAMTVKGKMTGDLILLNYYEPFQNRCPNIVPDTQHINEHLAHDLDVTIRKNATMIDIFNVFGGTRTPNQLLCRYTWACNYGDVHANNLGYLVMARAMERRVRY